jgi:serpin B
MKGFTILLLGVAAMWTAAAGLTRAQLGVKLEPDTAALVKGNTQFAFDLYAKLRAEKGNLFFSPYSISNALAMTYTGARGDTAKEMADTLHLDLGQKRLHPAFKDLIGLLNGDPSTRKYQLYTANLLWGQKGYNFHADFLKSTEANYGAGLKEVDFKNATEKARQAINQWVEDQTNQKIKELFKPNILNINTRLVLTNAIYFKAAWMNPFAKDNTKDADFTLADGKKVSVPTMHQKNLRARFFKGDGFSLLELPYEKFELSMLLFLPDKSDGLADFEKKLTADNEAKWLPKLSTHLVDVALPKFKITTEFFLNDVLKDMGMKTAFVFGKADFSGISSEEKLYIQAVVHKAYVDVNEKGTEAAAATGVAVGTKSEPPPATFNADHPFVFVIRENRTGSILFAGRIMDPQK